MKFYTYAIGYININCQLVISINGYEFTTNKLIENRCVQDGKAHMDLN